MALAQVLADIPAEKEWKKLASKLNGKKVVLASASPRRKFLFEMLEIPFAVFPSEVDEEACIRNGAEPAQLAVHLAEMKAEEVMKKTGADLVIAADTLVALGKKVFGKPKSKKEALAFLSELSGKKHQVYTGLCVLTSSGKKFSGADKTDVFFYDVEPEAVFAYLRSGEGMDKAGAYGIQGMGSFLVEKIGGHLDNVVGLPRLKLLELLKKAV
jgi:septum formation protein